MEHARLRAKSLKPKGNFPRDHAHQAKITKTNHLDVPFRTVSRGSRVPQGQFSEGPEKVREGLRKLEKVRDLRYRSMHRSIFFRMTRMVERREAQERKYKCRCAQRKVSSQ